MNREREYRWKTLAVLISGVLAACSTPQPGDSPPKNTISKPPAATGRPSPYSCTYAAPSTSKGLFYKEDGPLELPHALDRVPEPLPRQEPLHRWANNPYTVLGQNFTPLKTSGTLKERGIGSWYGRKFHGQKTSSGEPYDMFAMTAAHPTLPIPSYARVTHLRNGRSVVVRINDRGPFLKGRVIDLSFLAACRLGYAANGSAEVEVISLNAQDSGLAQLAETSAPSRPPRLAGPERTSLDQALFSAQSPASGGAIFLQLGAFSSRANAESFHAHLLRELDSIQATRLVIQESGSLYRVRLGPYPDRTTALAAAEQLTGKTRLPALISR